MKVTPFKELLDQYSFVLFDSYGVLKNYEGIIDGVAETLQYIRTDSNTYRILTNDASSSPGRLSEKFKRGGLEISDHRIITSGMMARSFLSTKTIEGKVLYLGTESSSAYVLEAGKERLSAADYAPDMLDEIGCIVFLDDEGYDWHHAMNTVVNILRKRSIPTIVANSDLLYPVRQNEVSIATGALARLVEQVLGRKFIHFGKPDVQMFAHAYADLQEGNPDLQKQDILMVGDTLHTDILGAIKFGIDTALVLTGNTTEESLEVAIGSTGIQPDYVCHSIAF
ncbi:MAG: HAD-IIA family hydrolase [Saprospiraceae bacterium]|nr:HAD-IIA family hydrolase [Saprospiraceae bacterium]